MRIQIPAGKLVQYTATGQVVSVDHAVSVVPTLVKSDGKFERVYFRLAGNEFYFIREGN